MLLLLEYLFSLNANTLIIFLGFIPFWKNVISRVLYHKYIGLLCVKKKVLKYEYCGAFKG